MNKNTFDFSIEISDNFCCYRYNFETKNSNISIYDIAKIIAKKLKTTVPEGKFINKKLYNQEIDLLSESEIQNLVNKTKLQNI
jgi:hypothetical protein